MSRRSPILVVFAAAMFVAVCVAVAAAESEVSYTGVVRAKYLYDTNDEIDASVSDARVELDVNVGELTLGTVYRAYLLSDESYNPAGVEEGPVLIKHRYLSFNHNELSMTAGSFFETFGHGLTLRSYEDIDLEYDAVLDGLRASYTVGGVRVTALTGTATEDVEGSRYYDYVVSAARAEMPLSEYARIAGSVVQRARTQKDVEIDIPDDVAHEKDAVVGSELSIWAGPATIAAEYASRDGENPVTGEDRITGHALYASGTLDLGRASLLGEYKDYEDYEYYLVNPPTAVREYLWTLMNRATYEVDLNDEKGFLIEGSSSVGEAVYLDASASEARSHAGDLRHWEMYGQADWSIGDNVSGSLAASWSREYLFVVESPTGKFDDRKAAAASAEFQNAAGQALELSLETQTTDDVEGSTYRDYIASLACYPGEDWTLIGTLERTTSESESRSNWFMAEVRKLVTENIELSLAAGTERGGKKCTGGICFDEPEFEGVRLRCLTYF
jgi:hypothetical protein